MPPPPTPAAHDSAWTTCLHSSSLQAPPWHPTLNLAASLVDLTTLQAQSGDRSPIGSAAPDSSPNTDAQSFQAVALLSGSSHSVPAALPSGSPQYNHSP